MMLVYYYFSSQSHLCINNRTFYQMSVYFNNVNIRNLIRKEVDILCQIVIGVNPVIV